MGSFLGTYGGRVSSRCGSRILPGPILPERGPTNARAGSSANAGEACIPAPSSSKSTDLG